MHIGQAIRSTRERLGMTQEAVANAGNVEKLAEQKLKKGVEARHILVKTSEEAEQLKQRIAKGEAFDVLAKKYSTCPSAKRGGDLGEVRPGQMVGVCVVTAVE